MIKPCRKTDFALVIGALLILWGPGLTAHQVSSATPPMPLPATTLAPPMNPCDNDRFPEPEVDSDYSHLASVQVTITGYSSCVTETDDTPNRTATNTLVRQGVIALSQDLLEEFTPGAPFAFHDVIEIPGLGRFHVEDTMHPRWVKRADLWFPSKDDAFAWGVRSRRIYRLPGDQARALPLPAREDVAETFGSANFQ
jgi:3D (Asp-Asp-Asp) domain-containing protein